MEKNVFFKFLILILFFNILINFTLSKEIDISKFSLEQKISQMLILGFRGTSINTNSEMFKFFREYSVGGIILFDKDIPDKKNIRNIENPKKLKKLIKNLNKINTINPFISIDQEGGKVSRLKKVNGFKKIPEFSQEFLGEVNSINFTKHCARNVAFVLKKLGINMIYAPCTDVNINPKSPIIGNVGRSFSSDPKITSIHSKILIDTYRENKIIPVIKHFPGHGSSKTDTHLNISNVSKTYNKEKELFPYKYLINLDIIDAIMTAHIYNDIFDKQYPATMSKKTLDFLRKDLNYNGLIISDDMMMKGITLNYSLENSLEKAINAGVNIFIFSNNNDIYDDEIGYKIINIVKKLINNKKVKIETINNSFKKIIKLKQKYKII